ncbi:hypothetical protein GCM10025865_27290 [Paraoerskovia sediminicola]|uniref:Schlafen AlbA-2 domain-containing protein n=1 Tax=Paraoerskovia sediminicola TaxID=1138587 RepID=A0ABM8G5P5_9CELL|nr:RNA-binding domain-containing protein [Paraoerskovia sediminicola]BDZ43430.1 hypothetical protein GCM10025865_27290 [Paraoerskovia sediminicola]
MSITWSPLHAALGIVARRRLLATDITAAIDANIRELSGLDFKGERRNDEYAKAELAKDIAAMANTGGGMVVFGVGESGEGASKRLTDTPIELVDQAEQQVRMILHQRVRPLILGLSVDFITHVSDQEKGYLLVLVPDSTDAPHFYERGNDAPPAAPRRHGSHTLNMSERELERAYRDRFARQSEMANALAHSFEGTVDRLAASAEVWAIAVSKPLGSVPLGVELPGRNSAQQSVRDATTLDCETHEGNESRSILEDLETNPRQGLRRWVLRYRSETGRGTIGAPYAELHHDGTVVLAYPALARRTPNETDDRVAIEAGWVEQISSAIVALTVRWHRERALHGGARIRIGARFDASSSDASLWLHGMERAGFSYPCIPDWSFPVMNVEPTDVILQGEADLRARADVAVELAESVLHQFGYAQIRTLTR